MASLLQARTSSKMLASHLYGSKVGTAFNQHAGNEIFLEMAQAVYVDILRLADPVDVDKTWKKYSGLLSPNKADQRIALRRFVEDKVSRISTAQWDDLDRNGKPLYGLNFSVDTPDQDLGYGPLSRDGLKEDLRWSYNW